MSHTPVYAYVIRFKTSAQFCSKNESITERQWRQHDVRPEKEANTCTINYVRFYAKNARPKNHSVSSCVAVVIGRDRRAFTLSPYTTWWIMSLLNKKQISFFWRRRFGVQLTLKTRILAVPQRLNVLALVLWTSVAVMIVNTGRRKSSVIETKKKGKKKEKKVCGR